jgi:murein DD-endopeptidase MepM/ murein hydrolase activator NlpD
MMARSRGFWVEDEKGVGSYYDDSGRPLRKAFLKSPLNYRRISSGFSRSRKHPVTRKVVPHHGIDFAADPGTPVVATADGKITSAGWDGALGKAVRIKHGSTYETIYGHLQGFAKGIRRGVDIRQNQVIGHVGSTGRATGPHLHYTLRVEGRAINPTTFKNPPAAPLAPELQSRLASNKSNWLPVLQSIVVGDRDYEVASTTGANSLPHGL